MLRHVEDNGVRSTVKEVFWWEQYTAAMLELEPTKLQDKIEAARSAIQQRAEELMGMSCDARSSEERQAMDDALCNLRMLQKLEFKLSNSAAMSENEWAGGAAI